MPGAASSWWRSPRRSCRAWQRLAERAAVNGVPARLVGPQEAREREPYARCVQALWVESTGIVDYLAVSAALADDVKSAGG